MTQRQVRTGEPLYLKSLDCHCFDPNNTFVLNPAAWADPAPGQYGFQTYYGDFRGQRRPVENFSFGRQFRVQERISLNVRAEFTNMFNRAYLSDPRITGVGVSPQTAPTCTLASGKTGACSPACRSSTASDPSTRRPCAIRRARASSWLRSSSEPHQSRSG